MQILTIRNKQTKNISTCVNISLDDFKQKYRQNYSYDELYLMFNSDGCICDLCGLEVKYELDENGIELPVDVFMLHNNTCTICKYCFNKNYEIL
jgi:hypothetical protein